MNRVSLVCTVHAEQGLANASELREILERIRPEVIFLEVPPAAFDDYFTICSRENLESIAVRQYREFHHVDLVPVDLPTPDEEFFSNNLYLFQRIEAASRDYCRLVDSNSASLRAFGFGYLNSDQCSKAWSAIYAETLRTIKRTTDPRLVEFYELWNTTIDSRERGMLENIQKYCRENEFDRGVFLAGAAHRQRIIDKAREQLANGSARIEWDFSSVYNDDGTLIHD